MAATRATPLTRLSLPSPREAVTRAEWRWAALFTAAVLAATTVPYVVAALTDAADPAWEFSGMLLGVEDGNSYLAKMGLGARGEWLFTLPYSSEPHRPVFLYPYYLLLGRLTGPAHAARIAGFHAARLVSGAAMLLAGYAFLAEYLPRTRERRLGLVLVALGGGLGWLLTLLGKSQVLGSLPLDFYSPEAFSFLTLLSLPHLAAARALLLLAMLAHLRGRPAWAGGALLGVALIQPLYVLVAWAVLGLDVLAQAWLFPGGGAGARRERAGRALLAGLLPAPVVAYTIWAFLADPVLAQWNVQNRLASPHPLHYLLALGPWVALAAVGWPGLRARAPRLAAFAAAWLLAAALLVYFPMPTQRRLVEGVQLPLAALAVAGMGVVQARKRRWLLPVGLAGLLPTSLLLWLGALAVAQVPAEPIFVPAGQVAAFNWLADSATPGEVALGAYATGNALPAYAPVRVYIGHGPETVFLAQKAPRVAAFYGEATEAERRALLGEGRVRWVLHGPPEQALGAFDPGTAPYLRLAYGGEYRVYEVADGR